MQVVVIETPTTVLVMRKNAKKGQGKTLGEFSRADLRGWERASAYIARKGHTIVERFVMRPDGKVSATAA